MAKSIDTPTGLDIQEAFEALGTHVAVASHFGVSRPTVRKWLRMYALSPISRPTLARVRAMQSRLANGEDRVRVAQWIIDEGSITVSYISQQDCTYIGVRGSMIDNDVMQTVGSILGARVVSSNHLSPRSLPHHSLRLYGACALALLECIRSDLRGLKRAEADAAIEFFRPKGFVPGRHPTYQFLLDTWTSFADMTLEAWNARKLVPLEADQISIIKEAWMKMRISKSRRYFDAWKAKLV